MNTSNIWEKIKLLHKVKTLKNQDGTRQGAKIQMLAGVLAGISHTFKISPYLTRIAFVIGLLILPQFFICSYIILAILLPTYSVSYACYYEDIYGSTPFGGVATYAKTGSVPVNPEILEQTGLIVGINHDSNTDLK